ncbi:MULE domain-containing protein [Aphis craccivora]|uniref:MULE domain-containing protein n=1 Tax=Aphis craccivora TaxID=307492 RepID=A0A6G0YHN3_APHCR|nr:MULE domain-containing protein [Aphis craccivora]
MQKVLQSHKASESTKLNQIQVLEDGAGYLMTSSSDTSRTSMLVLDNSMKLLMIAVEQQMLLEMNESPKIFNKNRKIQSQAELILGLSQNNFDDRNWE